MPGQFVPMTMADGASVSVLRVDPPGERRGGVVVVQEIFGVTDHIRDVSESYAAQGYEVLAPALFDREEPGFAVGYSGDDLQRAIQLARQVHPFDLSLSDVQTCIDALAPRGPVFVVGYCYGGSVAWLASTRLHGLAAASGYYGSMVPGTADEQPRVPVALHFGRHDGGIPMAGVEAVIARGWPNASVYVYDAGHGFNSDRRQDHAPEAAALARERTLALFRAHGG